MNRLVDSSYDERCESFTYNKQGNTIKEEAKNGNNIFKYNALNQAVKVITKEGNTLVSRYDTEGLRCEIEENKNGEKKC